MKKTGALLIGSALGLAAGQTMASGFGVSYQSVSAMGTAYAGAGVLSENASNQWYNPATLAGLKKTELSLALHQVWVDTHFEADGVSGPGDLDDIEPFVGSGFLAVPIGETMTFGLSIVSPFGTKIEYENNWGNATGLPAPNPATTGDIYATESDLQTININPSLGIQVTDNLNVGVGVSYQTLDAKITNDATILDGDDDSYGWNVGLTYSPDDNNHFGAAYRSEVDFEVDGDITFTPLGSAGTGGLIPAGSYDGSADVTLPASLQLSYAGDLSDNTQILLGVEWMEWSSLDKLEVDTDQFGTLPPENFNWDNTTRYSLGMNHSLNAGTVLRIGVAMEESTQATDNR